MKKHSVAVLILILITVSGVAAQKGKGAAKKVSAKRPPAPTKPATAAPATNAARVIGSNITLTTKGGNIIAGTLVDLSPYSVRIKSAGLESTLPLETLASISFDSTVTAQAPPATPLSETFMKSLTAAFTAFQTMASETKTGSDYTDYGKQLSELRRNVETFIQRYSSSENSKETQIVSLLSGAIIDYTWARTIWTLKLGGDGTVAEADNPVMADTLALYPDLRTATANGNRFSADKLIGSLWKRANDKVERARSMMNR
jgi:hypothetical protein